MAAPCFRSSSFSIALLLLLLFSFFFFPVPLLPGFLSPSALVRLRRRPTDMRVDATRWRSARPAAVYTRARLVSGLFFLFFFWFGQQKAWSSSFGLRHLRYRCIKRVRCFNYYLVPWHRFVHSSHLTLVLALTPSPRQWFFLSFLPSCFSGFVFIFCRHTPSRQVGSVWQSVDLCVCVFLFSSFVIWTTFSSFVFVCMGIITSISLVSSSFLLDPSPTLFFVFRFYPNHKRTRCNTYYFYSFFFSSLCWNSLYPYLHVQMSSFVSTCLSPRRWLPPNGRPMTLFAVISLYCFFITENTCFCRPYTCVSPSVSAPFSCVVLSSRLASPVLLLARHHFFQWTW